MNKAGHEALPDPRAHATGRGRLWRARRAASGLWLLAILWASCAVLWGVERFPPPEFESDYRMPSPTAPAPRATAMEYVDVAVLVGALALGTFLVHRKRSRRWILGLTVFSLLYFGFYRKGCVCAIGSIQDVTLALFNPGYAVPWSVVLFFLAPLVTTLFFGRTFCAGVCPLGAIQDVVLIKPAKLPAALGHALSVVPFAYLGAAVLFAATGAAFVICEFDPFVAFFRRSGSFAMVAFGGSLLALGTVVGRPYCRFLCPYGSLLSIFSRFARWNVTLSPLDCIRCQICDVACPYDAIHEPAPARPMFSISRLAGYALLIPVLVGVGGWLGGQVHVPLSKKHPTVALAESIAAEDAAKQAGLTDATRAFRQRGTPSADLMRHALEIRARFQTGGWLLGGFIGLVFALKLAGLVWPSTYATYEPDRADCVACGRCFTYCPKEISRQKKAQRSAAPAATPA
jgi:ferredoxin